MPRVTKEIAETVVALDFTASIDSRSLPCNLSGDRAQNNFIILSISILIILQFLFAFV